MVVEYPYELIIMDNASTDATAGILDKYEGRETAGARPDIAKGYIAAKEN